MAVSHRVGVLRQVINALRKTFDSGYPDPLLRDIYVGGEFQMESSDYPNIIVRYNERLLQNIGMGHYVSLEDTDPDGIVRHWYFEGTVVFTVMALTLFERETLMDNLVSVIGMSKDTPGPTPFFNEVYDDDFIILNMNTENIIPGGVTSGPVPWSSGNNEIIFSGQYSVDVNGEFFSDIGTMEMVTIHRVVAYPYRFEQGVPSGADDPADWQ